MPTPTIAPCITMAWPAEKPPPSGNIMMPAKPRRRTKIQDWLVPRMRPVSAARWMLTRTVYVTKKQAITATKPVNWPTMSWMTVASLPVEVPGVPPGMGKIDLMT